MPKLPTIMKSHSFLSITLATVFLTSFPLLGRAETLGEQLAEYSKTNSQSGKECFEAVYNRVKHVFTKNNKSLPSIDSVQDKTSPFKMNWVTNFDFAEWKNVNATYRACGPAGALAMNNLATLVNHQQIWSGGLKPGAVVQVWDVWDAQNAPSGKKANGVAVFDALHAGKDYTNKMGHSFIFIAYKKDAAGKITSMEIADQGTGWNPVAENKFGLWIGANLKD